MGNLYQEILKVFTKDAEFGFMNGKKHYEKRISSKEIPATMSFEDYLRKAKQESLKQISEWAAVTESPWNNEENIAIKAREFFDKLYFNQNFISLFRTLNPFSPPKKNGKNININCDFHLDFYLVENL